MKFLASNAFGYGSDGRTPNLASLHELLLRLKEFGVPEICLESFPAEVRPDFVTEEVLELVKPFISNRTIVMGIQSGDDAVLRSINRGHTAEQACTAVKLLRRYGYTPHVDFIIGFPGETFEQQDALLTFMEDLAHQHGVRIHMHTFMPLPGTPLSSHRAAVVSEKSRQRLKKLAASGILDGWWENQIGYKWLVE